MNLKHLLNKIAEGIDLTSKEAESLLEEVIQGRLKSSQIAAILMGLRTKGEAVSEIIGFIKVMRKHMVNIKLKSLTIDIVGTGGDGIGTFNISTAASFVVAGAGVKVSKHGNRAASSKCGSADVLEALGVNIYLKPAEAKEVLEKAGMVFLFAPLYHPAMKNIAPIRKDLGIRTVFNYLGPFLNPASTRRQLIGVPNLKIAQKLAKVAAELNFDHLVIFASKDGMDEISIFNESYIFEIKRGLVRQKTIHPSSFGIKNSAKKDILGGNAVKNAQIIRGILDGKKGAVRDIVVLNSAFALYVAGRVKNIKEGIKLAERSIDTGSARKVLEKLIEESVERQNFISKIIDYKKRDLEGQKKYISFEMIGNNITTKFPKFKSALQNPKNKKFAIIAEVKLASPTFSNLGFENEIESRAKNYEKNGADVISLITEKHFFRGKIEHVERVKKSVSLPILQKDFVIDPYQIYEAKQAGSESILLIAKLIDEKLLADFVSLAKSIGVEPLIEINDEKDLEKALKTNTEIIAVNARDLDNFVIDLDKACRLLKQIPNNYIKLGFSGISSKIEVQRYIRSGAQGILVGTNLMKAGNIKEFIGDLR